MYEKVNKRKYRVKGKGLAVASCTPEVQLDEYEPYIRKQVARTFGMMRDFGHPDVEVLYNFGDQPYHYPLLSLIHSNVSKGMRYKACDRISFKGGVFEEDFTAEFRNITVNGEELLRAVILELDGEYQSLPTEQAAAAVIALCESNSNNYSSF